MRQVAVVADAPGPDEGPGDDGRRRSGGRRAKGKGEREREREREREGGGGGRAREVGAWDSHRREANGEVERHGLGGRREIRDSHRRRAAQGPESRQSPAASDLGMRLRTRDSHPRRTAARFGTVTGGDPGGPPLGDGEANRNGNGLARLVLIVST